MPLDEPGASFEHLAERWVRGAVVSEPGAERAALIRRFFEILDAYTPQLVSWNGSGFDLPVLHYRAMIHGVTAV